MALCVRLEMLCIMSHVDGHTSLALLIPQILQTIYDFDSQCG